MLYIASALTPTPILDTFSVSGLTSPQSKSLVVAKPDRVEVWDVNEEGLSFAAELELWGSVISITPIQLKDVRPHIAVLLSPPNAHLLLLSYSDTPKASLVVSSAIPLTPPTPSLRQAEFFTSVIAQDNIAVVSLWVGVLSCIEIEVEKEKDAKKRRSSVAGKGAESEGEAKRLKFKDNFNINIREHNLLHLAFVPPSPTQAEPIVTFLWLSSTSNLQLQTRKLSLVAHSLLESSKMIDVVTPTQSVSIDEDTDFNEIPYSCPAARRVLAVSYDSAIVIGDEYSVLYSLSPIPNSPKVSRGSISSSGGIATSPRASAIRRSPQTEMMGTGKRRKSSMSSGRMGMENSDKMDLRPVWRSRQGFGTVLAACTLESHSTGGSVLLGDECGRLTAIGWESERFGHDERGNQGNMRLNQISLGIASPPSSLTYLDSAHIFVSSACGDSTLLQLQLPTPGISASPASQTAAIAIGKGKGRARDNDEAMEQHDVFSEDKGSVEIKERWMNLAPLKDFCVVEDGSGGLSHLVAASGASTSNSLRVIRSGVGLEEVVRVPDVHDITGLFPIGTTLTGSESPTTSMLISTSTSTTWLKELDPDFIPGRLNAEIASSLTLAASTIQEEQQIAHVSPRAVTVWNSLDNGTSVGRWDASADDEIVAASISGDYILVGRRNGVVMLFQATAGKLQSSVEITISGEISALNLFADNDLATPVIAISTWSNEIMVYTAETLKNSDSWAVPIKEGHFAVSLMLHPSAGSDTSGGIKLLAGLSDGTMVLYEIETSAGGDLEIKSRKASSLGTKPLKLYPANFQREGDEMVFAVGISDRMSVIFESKDRIDFSSVSTKNAVSAVGVNIRQLDGDVLVLADAEGFSLANISSLKKLSVQTLDLAERSPTKLVCLNDNKLLGLGSVTRNMDRESGDVIQIGYFELRNSTSLEMLVEMKLKEREEVTCLNEVFLLGRYYLAVGTAIFPSEDEMDEFTHGGTTITAKEGRVLLIEPKSNESEANWEIELKASMDTVGPVHDVKVIHGFLAVAAGSKVGIHRLEPSPFTLHEASSFSLAFIAQHLQVLPPNKDSTEERLVLGDGMRSIFVFDVDPESGLIYNITKDMATHQVMNMESIKDGSDSVVIADGHSNLLTLRLGGNIESAASFGLHEDIARFRKGSLVPPSSAPETLTPELIYGTSDGRLGIIGELTKSATKTLVDLQRNMDKYYLGPGGINWKTWRRGGTELVKKETAGFIDGDFVQKFLDTDLMPSSDNEKVLSGTTSHERISKLVNDTTSEEATRGDVARILEAASGLH